MFRNRSLILGVAFLVPLLMLVAWAVSAAPLRCSFYQNLGYAHLLKGTQDSTRAQLTDAQNQFSSPSLTECRGASVSFGLGQSYSRLGQQWSAISALENGVQRSGLRRLLIARLYEDMGRQADAWRMYLELPLDAAAHFYKLGVDAQRAGDFRQALHYYSVSATINPGAFKSYYASAFVYWRQLGDDASAVQMIRRALAVDPTSSGQREFYRGLLCYYEGKTSCAVAAWVSAAENPLTVEYGTSPRYLAYEMLGRALVASRATAAPLSAAVFS